MKNLIKNYSGGIIMNRLLNISISFSLICISSFSVLAAQNPAGQSLVQAIAESSADQIQYMISNGANVNETNSLGWTPLHAAIRFANDDVIDILLNNGANINAKDNSGKTPLYAAVETGQKLVVDKLISKGADVNIADNNGNNPLSLARMVGLKTIEGVLMQNNATMPNQDMQGQETPGARRGMPGQEYPGVRRGMPGQENPGARRGMPGQGNQFPGNMGNRFGGPRGNADNNIMNNPINPEPLNPQMTPEPVMPEMQQATEDLNNIILDPNEVKARMQKYEGLEKAVGDITDGYRTVERQWKRTDEDNRTLIISATRRQFESEAELIVKTANEEKAKKTSEAAEKMIATRKERFAAITREVRDAVNQAARSNTTSSRRSSRGMTTTTTTRSSRRGGNLNTDVQPNMDTQSTTERKRQYEPEIQNEIDIWLDADVESINGRLDLMNTLDSIITSEINTIKRIAIEEKAEKTIAAIDGLLVARQKSYDSMKTELEEEMQNDNTQLAPAR